jgi:hypothetical protein
VGSGNGMLPGYAHRVTALRDRGQSVAAKARTDAASSAGASRGPKWPRCSWRCAACRGSPRRRPRFARPLGLPHRAACGNVQRYAADLPAAPPARHRLPRETARCSDRRQPCAPVRANPTRCARRRGWADAR